MCRSWCLQPVCTAAHNEAVHCSPAASLKQSLARRPSGWRLTAGSQAHPSSSYRALGAAACCSSAATGGERPLWCADRLLLLKPLLLESSWSLRPQTRLFSAALQLKYSLTPCSHSWVEAHPIQPPVYVEQTLAQNEVRRIKWALRFHQNV